MMMHEPMTKLFLSLSLGYIICVVARKQQDMLKTLGYTIGIAIIVFSLGGALLMSLFMPSHPMHKGMGAMKMMCCGGKSMNCPMMK